MGKVYNILVAMLLVILWIVGMFVSSGIAADKGTYQRKSISYVDMLWLATPDARKIESNPAQMVQLLSTIKREIKIERFDYNDLPEDLFRKFRQEAAKEETLTLERAGEILNATMGSTITEVLNTEMIARAEKAKSAEEFEAFIESKAHDQGLTAEHFKQILNSAHIFLPVLTDYSRSSSKKEITEDGKTVTRETIGYELKGGGVLFSLKVDALSGKGRIEVVGYIDEGGSSSSSESDSVAFTGAADTLAQNVFVRVTELLPLIAQVIEPPVGLFGKVGFNLGKDEGIFVDQKFRVYEDVEDEYGKVELDKKGFFMARKINDNRENKNILSYGQPIIGDYAYGMKVKEYPRFPADILCRIATSKVKIDSGETGFLSMLSIDEEIDTLFPVANLAIHTNTARASKISQFFVTAGGNLGLVPTDGAEMGFLGSDPQEIDFGWYWNAYVSLMKKYYFGRFAFIVEPRYEYQRFELRSSEELGEREIDLAYTNSFHMLSATLGFEIALREDINFGIMAGFKGLGYNPEEDEEKGGFEKFVDFIKAFKYPPVQNEWKEKYSWTEGEGDDKIEEEHKNTIIGPEIDYTSPFIGIYITYSPATFW